MLIASPITSSQGEADRASYLLAQLARQTKGLSGRLLRRLPVLALARHIASPTRPVPTATWIEAMSRAAADAQQETRQVQAGSSAQQQQLQPC